VTGLIGEDAQIEQLFHNEEKAIFLTLIYLLFVWIVSGLLVVIVGLFRESKQIKEEYETIVRMIKLNEVVFKIKKEVLRLKIMKLND